MDFAARHPGRLKTLTLCDTHKGFAGWSDEKKKAFIASRKEPLLAGKEPKDIAEPVARTLVGPNASAEALDRLIDSMSRLHKESYIKSIEASVMMPVRDDLDRIKVPTLVLVGSEDRLTSVDMARELAAEIPGAEFVVIDDAGHLRQYRAAGRVQCRRAALPAPPRRLTVASEVELVLNRRQAGLGAGLVLVAARRAGYADGRQFGAARLDDEATAERHDMWQREIIPA